MADRKSRKKKKKQNNKSSRQKKINKGLLPQENENSSCKPTWKKNSIPHTENNSRSDQEYSGRSPSRGRISTCLQGVMSRIAGTFGRGPMTREYDPVALSCKDGQRHHGDGSSPSGELSDRRRASKTIKHDKAANGKFASTYHIDLFDAIQDLCKPKMYYSNDLPKMNISFSIEFHTGITSVLVEMYNNIPDFNNTKPTTDDMFFQSELLKKLIMQGVFAGCYFKFVSKRYKREKILAFIQDKKGDTLLSNRSKSKKMIFFFTTNTGSILQKPRSKGNFANVKRNTEKTSLLYNTNKNRLTGNMLVTSNFMKSVNISCTMNPCLLGNMVRDTTRTAQSELTSSVVPPQSSKQSLGISDTGLQFLFSRRKMTRLYLGPIRKVEPLSQSKTLVDILFKFKSTKQRLFLPINAFMSILEIIQKELMETTKGAVTKALKFKKDNARPIRETDKNHVEIAIKIPGLAPLQVSMVPISFVQNILQRSAENNFHSLLNKHEIAAGRLIQNIERALQFSTRTNIDRKLTFVGSAKQKQVPKLFPAEAKLAVAKRFLQSNNDTCRPNLNIEKNLQISTGTNLDINLTFVGQVKQKQRPKLFPEEAILVVAKRFQQINNNTCRPIMSIGKAIHLNTEDKNFTLVGPTKQKQRRMLIPEKAKLAVAEWFPEVNNHTHKPNLTFFLKLDDTVKIKPGDGETEDADSRENFKHETPDKEDINIENMEEADADIYDSAQFEFFGGESELNEVENTDGVCLDNENVGLRELELKYDSTQYEFFGGIGESEITDGIWLEDESPGLDESEFKYDSTQYDFFGSAPDEDLIIDKGSLDQASSGLFNLESVDEKLEAQYGYDQYDFFGDAIDVEDIMDGEVLGGELGDLDELEFKTDHHPDANIPDIETDIECSGVLQAGITPTGDFQEFNSSVPHHLGQVNVPFKDIEELLFETDEEGEKVLLSSGGFGDVYLARMANATEQVIVKKTKNMKFVGILKETRIQTYLMPGHYVPAIEGIIGGPGHSETMIIQQFCASGRTLYDMIQACHAESLTLFDVHWLKLAYKLAVCFDDMHRKGVLHNDIKTDNILVEIKPDDIQPYIIDFGMASFRTGGRLMAPSGCSDCSSYDDYLAPEVRKCELSSPKSDIYSLGKVLYEIAYYFCDDLGPLSVDMCADVAKDRPSLKEVAHYIENLMVQKDLS